MSPQTRLEQLRRDRFMSRADLALETGVSKGTIRRLEERLGEPQIATLRKLSVFFDLPPSELLGDAVSVSTDVPREAQAA